MTRKAASGLTSQHAIAFGVAFTVLGSYLLWEGYERSGRNRPWPLRFLPGP